MTWDIFIVRMLPFVLFLIFGINLLCTWLGIDISILYHLHSNSALYALALFLISLSNKKYHCIWNRAMYLFLIIVPVLNFTDCWLDYIPTAKCYLIIITVFFVLASISTAYLSVKHFIDTRNKKKHYGRTAEK